MKIAAIWARVSTKSQEEISPEGQVERVNAKLEGMGYIPQYIFKVVWTSADLKPCPQFQELQRLVRDKQIQAVGMLDRDRIEADGLQRLNFLAECKVNGVEPVAYQGVPFLEGDEGRLVELALALAKGKQLEGAQKGAKRGLDDRAHGRSKHSTNMMPPTKRKLYGYKWDGGKWDGKYVPDENYHNACLIFQLWFEKYNIDYILSELFKRGIPSSRHKTLWPDSSIRNLLKNPIYAGRVGTLRYEKVEPKQRRKNTFGKTSYRIKPENEWHYLDGLVESPIITWEQHVATKERLKHNKQYATRNAKRNYLLRSLIECQLCHRHYYGVVPSSGKPKYVCSNSWGQAKYARKCHAKSIDQGEIESSIKAKIINFLENPMVFSTEAENRLSLQEETIDKVERGIADLEKEYRNTIDEEWRLASLLSDEAFKAKQPLLVAKRTWLNEETERQKEKLANLQKYTVTAETIMTMKHRLHYNLYTATDEEWRLTLESLGVKIIAFGDGHWDIEIHVPVPRREGTLIANKIGWCTFSC